jgi:membrane AbrB-like protein
LTEPHARGIDRAHAVGSWKPPSLSAPSSTDFFAKIRDVAETLAVAVVGGLALGLTGFPGGYLSGAIIAVGCVALAGRPMHIPTWLMRTIFVFIGISLGSVVTPETLTGMATYPLSIAVLIVAMAVISVAGAQYLRVVHGWNTASAYLGAAPGGLSQVLALAVEIGADVRAIAIVQTMRVVIVAVGLPAGLGLLGLVGKSGGSIGGSFNPDTLDELAILVASSTVMGIAANYVRFPGGLLFGAMLTSAILHGTGWIHAVMPWWVANTAMIALGAVTGSRFGNTPLRLLLNFVTAAFGSFAVSVVVAAIFAAGLMAVLPLRVAEVMIAFAPGSVDAMMLLALALHLDPVYVGAHHLTRIFLISLAMPFVARGTAHTVGRPDEPPKPPLPPPTFQD